MSTTEVLLRGGADAQSTDQRARAAVKVFHRMQPSLSAYARALTGKADVRVVVSPNSNGHTDGKKIFFRPPLALGDNTPHQRKLCDIRDTETMRQMCPACDVREQVLIVIYHEIGHIAFGSFEEMSENDRAEALKYGLSLVDRKYAAALMQRVEQAPLMAKSTYIGMAGLVSPYLPGIVNALEDARVNRSSAIARKGTKIMFEVDTMRVLSDGFEQKMPDGTVQQVFWRNRPLNAQMICALYSRFAGYAMEEHFVPEVIAALDDPKIMAIKRDFATVRNAKGVYALSIALLVRLRELGFYKHDTDPEVEDEPEQEQQDQQDDQSSDDEQEESQDDDGTDEGDAGSGGTEGDPDDAEGSAEQGAAGGDESGEETGDPSESDGGGSSSSEDGPEAEPSEDQEGADGGEPDADSSGDGDPGLESGTNADDDSDPQDADGSGPDQEEAEGSDDGSDDGQDDGTSSDDSRDGSAGTEEDTGSADEQNTSQDDTDNGGQVDEPGSEGTEASDSGSSDGAQASEDGTDSDTDSDQSTRADASPGARGDHDPTEGGQAVPSVDSEAPLDEPSNEGESDADQSAGNLDSESHDGTDASDPGSEEADGVQSDSSHESGDDATDDTPDGSEEDRGDIEAVDSGADDGLGGVEIVEDSAFDRLPMGDPDEVNGTIHEIAHPEERPDHIKEEAEAADEMDRAIVQGLYFETPSRNVFGVREHHYGSPIMIGRHNMSRAWDPDGYTHWGYNRVQLGVEGDFECDEKILGPALLRMRVAFADNKRGHDQRNKRSGKVDGRVLGKRAHHGDDRLFKRRIIPGKKDYFVLIGIDISGSTIGRNIVLAKRAAMAQATLCHRMGIKFAVYAHSGNLHAPDDGRYEGLDMDIYHIKDADEPWTESVKNRLQELGPDSVNLDGHTFEFYRKILDTRSETHRVLLYYTDGKMPAENHDEELEILRHEIKMCRQRKYVLIGVGIRTDSPTQHGLDTVKVETDADLVKVVERLEKRLLEIQ